MHLPVHYSRNVQDEGARCPGRTALDIGVVVLVVAAVIAIAAHAPSDTYAFAQYRQIGAVLGTLNGGQWLLPRNHEGRLARKPQLYAWLCAPVVWATGAYEDFVFRAPTLAAAVATGVMVYLLGRRWYGRRAGLLAGCLWGTLLHMSKLSYIATTDMLLTVWFTASVLCVDRLVFHPVRRGSRLRWVVGLWATVILGALSKGWGVASIPLIAVMIAIAAAVGPGFKAARLAGGFGGKLGLGARLVARRWWGASRAIGLLPGLGAVLVVLGLLFLAMLSVGGEEFKDILRYEVWRRATGEGEGAPLAGSVPPAAALLFFTLPASVFAVGALVLTGPGRWFWRKGPLCIPLCWIAAVVIPYSLVHGFRPDYLLPCYAAVALMGGWAVDEIARRGRGSGKITGVLRHVFAAAPVILGLTVVCMGLALLYPREATELVGRLLGRWPKVVESVRTSLAAPEAAGPETWAMLAAAVVLGVVVPVVGVWASLRWRLRTVVAAAIVAMIGVVFLDTHFLSRHARAGDGENILRFARQVRPLIDDEGFAVYRMEKLGTELYLGRFGRLIRLPEDRCPTGAASRPLGPLDALNALGETWLLTCDRGLVELGAAQLDQTGDFTLPMDLSFPDQQGSSVLTGGAGTLEWGPDGRCVLVVDKARGYVLPVDPSALKRDKEGQWLLKVSLSFRVHPGQLGRIVAFSPPIRSQRWGRMYLIRLGPRPIPVTGKGINTRYVPGEPGT
jgi:4-amino-4-deoxy-L-arabinose transferase-like glycosyltransferase